MDCRICEKRCGAGLASKYFGGASVHLAKVSRVTQFAEIRTCFVACKPSMRLGLDGPLPLRVAGFTFVHPFVSLMLGR